MKLEGIAIVTLFALAGCPKGKSAPKTEVSDCADVEAHAVRLYSYVPPLRPANVGGDLFAQDAPPPTPPPDGPADGAGDDEPAEPDDADRAATNAEYARLEGKAWGAECSGNAWTHDQIVCYLASITVDESKACASSGIAPLEVADDPACVAAADQSAIRIANGNGTPDDEDVKARVRAAVLAPCREQRFEDDMLECLSDPEVVDSFGMCGMLGGADWERISASLNAAGFGQSE